MAEMWTRSPIMQGNTEQHQLALISQLCGSITPEVRGQAAWAPGPCRMQRSEVSLAGEEWGVEQKASSSPERWLVEGQGLLLRATQASRSSTSSVASGKASELLTSELSFSPVRQLPGQLWRPCSGQLV